LLGECCKSSSCAVHRGVGDGEDSHHYDSVHDRIEALDAGIFDGNYEWGRLGVNAISTDQLWTGVRYNKTDNSDGDDIKLNTAVSKNILKSQ